MASTLDFVVATRHVQQRGVANLQAKLLCGYEAITLVSPGSELQSQCDRHHLDCWDETPKKIKKKGKGKKKGKKGKEKDKEEKKQGKGTGSSSKKKGKKRSK